MMKKTSTQFVYILLINYFLISNVMASTPRPFDISFKFPDQGESIKQETYVNVVLSNAPQSESYIIKLNVSAITFVEPLSDITSLQIDRRIEANNNGIAIIPLTVFENGEYEVRVSVSLKTANGLVSQYRSFGIVAENGQVWFGRDTLGHAIKSKIRHQVESDPTISTENIEQKYRKKLHEEEQNRAIKAQTINEHINSQAKSRGNNTFVKGDVLVFEALWVGQGTGKLNTTTGNFNFPMHGAKITVSDKDVDMNGVPLTADISGYLVDGRFTFITPRDNYSYRVVIETGFSGIKPNGEIENTGNGIGSFKVLRGTSNGEIYSCQTEDTLTVVCDQTQTGSSELASVWSAFHGMAEMVKQAKLQLTVDKQSNFNVIFDHGGSGSAYNPNTNEILISIGHRYEWDVVAHEFGHAIAKETNAIDTNTGGNHNGSNQYDYKANSSTLHNKVKSLELSINEGFGTWFGTALLQNPSAIYHGRFKGISDATYDDASQLTSANLEGNTARLLSGVPVAYGEDTEVAILHLLWDLMDSNNEINTRARCITCKDTTSFNLNGLWDIFKDSNISSIIEFYQVLLQKKYGVNVADLLTTGENNINDSGLRGALDVSYTFAEFGIAPYLEKPQSKTKLDLVLDTSGPMFEWSQLKTGTLEGLTEYTLALYTFDLKTLVFKKTGISSNSYTLTNQDITAIKSEVDNLFDLPSSLIAVIIGENDYLIELESGPYISNPKEIMINNVDRTLVVVVDSSGSNTTTDPNNLRIEAAKETLRNLTSFAEAQDKEMAPDLAAAVDFDSTVTVLSELDDPDTVIDTLNTIDSSGGTNIAAGINAAIQILENLNTTGISGIIEDKAAITLFTDGENNAGQIPVIQAIVNATLKGIRVHYGFLTPIALSESEPLSVPSDAPPGYVLSEEPVDYKGSLPTTVEEAVHASGGVFAFIGNANSQVNFVTQVENRGFTNADNTDPGGQSVVDQTETFDILNEPLSTRSFQFSGTTDASVVITVDTSGNFHPFLKIVDINGNNIEVDNDADDDGIISLDFVLPYSGNYHAEITSQNGGFGSYSFQIEGIGLDADIIYKNSFEAVIGIPVISSFTANPENIVFGASTTLIWTITGNATSCIKSGDWTGPANSSNGTHSQVISNITSTSTYSLQCFNNFGSSQLKSVQVAVANTGSPPTLTLTANPTTVNTGGSSVISWTIGNDATNCIKSGSWSGQLTGNDVANGTHNEVVPNITTNSNFNLICTNSFGSSPFRTVFVSVSGSNTNCLNQPPILNGAEDFTIRLIPGATGNNLGTPNNPAPYNGDYDEIATGIGWPGDFGGTSFATLSRNQYIAMRFTTNNMNEIGKLSFVPPSNSQGPASQATTISISECPGDFNTHLNQARCLTIGGGAPNIRWSQDPSIGSPFYCSLEKNKTYYLNIVHSNDVTNNFNTSGCGLDFCGLIFAQTEESP